MPEGGNHRAERDRRIISNGVILDDLVKSPFYPDFVVPWKAEIQLHQAILGSRLRGATANLTFCGAINLYCKLGAPAGLIRPRTRKQKRRKR